MVNTKNLRLKIILPIIAISSLWTFSPCNKYEQNQVYNQTNYQTSHKDIIFDNYRKSEENYKQQTPEENSDKNLDRGNVKPKTLENILITGSIFAIVIGSYRITKKYKTSKHKKQ